MISIRSKISRAIAGSVAALGIFAVLILAFILYNSMKNQRIVQTMTLEYSIVALSDELVKSYNDVVKNPGNVQFTNSYNETKTKLLTTIEVLKTRITYDESVMLLDGVENTVKAVISDCERGLKEVEGGNFENISKYFAAAHKNNGFVLNNTSMLMQKELDFLALTQEDTVKINNLIAVGSITIFAVLVLVMLAYSNMVSLQIVRPIEELTRSVESIESEDTTVTIGEELSAQKDEVGILARAFEHMVKKIQEQIANLNKSNVDLEQAKSNLEGNNQKLEKMNRFMVDRELKMVELKKKIAELEKKV